MSQSPRLLGPWRRNFQRAVAAVFFLLPWLSVGGNSALRLDIPALTLYVAGTRLVVEEMYLAWLLVFCLIFAFLLMTLTLGRLWCGWLCPQTLVSDTADAVDRVLRRRGWWGVVFRHGGYLGLAFACAAGTVCYFLPPSVYWPGLVRWELGPWPLGTTVVLTVVGYVNIVFVRRLFCKAICPYGRFQTVLMDQGTLVLRAAPQEMERCIDCRSCVRVCPTGIDIREGFQIECINCARCLDACRQVMARRGEAGIIGYRFGNGERSGIGAAANLKRGALLCVLIALVGGFFYAAAHRRAVGLDIGRASIPPRTVHGKTITFFHATVANFTGRSQELTLEVVDADRQPLAIRGPHTFSLPPRGRRELTFAVTAPAANPKAPPRPVAFVLHGEGGKIFATIKGYL